ncbi:MAG TPA: hypothetical protein VG269_12495 [Tepidisphaeraceae bacterium]|jgi:hypothetical protein|nr:hypothetical protein [Tepidisphaeraceae bacterium]
MGVALQPQGVIDYVAASALLTCRQLFMLLGPVLGLAFVLHGLSSYVRSRAARGLGVDAYMWITSPGVMVHELGHALFCVVFGHKITKMKLFGPQADGTLGYVEHSYNHRNLYQSLGNFFIGTGPIWLGSAVVYLLSRFLLGAHASSSAVNAGGGIVDVMLQVAGSAFRSFTALLDPSLMGSWRFWVFAYLVVCIGSHITLSPPDIRGAFKGFLALVAAVLLFNLLTIWMGESYSVRACEALVRGSVVLYAALLFVVCVNLTLAGMVFVLSFLRGRLRG